MGKRMSLTIIFTFIIHFAIGQGNFTPVLKDYLTRTAPVSPAASVFQKYGDIPVNISSGSQQVTIPITALKVGNFTWPISLSYHTNGVKVSEIASDVGLGWVLNAGSIISQKMVGLNDLLSKNKFDTIDRDLDLGGFGGIGCGYNDPDMTQGTAFAEGTENGLPDLFYLNDPLRSVKFFLKFNDSGYTLPASGMQIAYNRMLNFDDSYWAIVDEEGNTYLFGNHGHTSTTNTCTNSSYNWLPTSHIFYLTRIITNQKLQIDFVYSDQNYSYNNPKEEVAFQAAFTGCNLCALSPPVNYSCTSNSQYDGLKLDSIKCSTGEFIALKYSSRSDLTGGNKVDSLIQGFKTSTQATVLKKWSLNYSYFNNGSGDVNLLRLKLTGVTKIGLINNPSEKYLLEYDSVNLPSRLSFAVDSFGFYNGKTANTTYLTSTANRSVDAAYLTAGTLTKITYPTGGYTLFEYGINRVYGGSEIRKVSDFDSLGNQSGIRKYVYKNHTSLPIPFVDQFEKRISTTNPSQNTQECTTPEYQICKYPEGFLYGYVCPFYRYKSSPATKTAYDTYAFNSRYDTVYEYFGDNGENGMNQYILDFPVNHTLSVYTGVGNQIVKTNTYKKELGGAYSLITSISDSLAMIPFTVLPANDKRVHFGPGAMIEINREEISTWCDINQIQSGCAPRTFLASYPTLFSTPLYKLRETTTNYVNRGVTTDSLKVVNTYTYSGHNQYKPVRISTTNSNGDQFSQYKKYAVDIVFAGAHLPVYDTLVKRNRLGAEVVDSVIKEPSTPLSLTKVNYNLWVGSLVAPASIQKSILGNQVTDDMLFNSYDDRGNIVTYRKANDFPTTVIWGYERTVPIAQVTNADSGHVAYTSFETIETGNWTGINMANVLNVPGITGSKFFSASAISISKAGLTNSVSYTVSYWSKNGAYTISGTQGGYPKNLGSVTINNGTWTLYEHLVTGQTTITITGTGAIDELRLYPSNARMNSYTYQRLVGMSASCDENNRIKYYEYDALRRLALIKDQYGSIVKKICYNYAGQAETCSFFGNVVKSKLFTRTNCTTGHGTSVTYTVPANTYFAATSVEADQMAQDDVDAQGQAYANANGNCTTATIYARVTAENHTYDTYDTYADIVVRFYSDFNCTLPVYVNNFTVNYRISTYTSEINHTSFVNLNTSCTGTSKVIATQTNVYTTDDFGNYVTRTYTLNTGTGYIVR